MNTANLQLEGLLLAVAALVDLLERKGLVSASEIDAALALAERRAGEDPHRPAALSAAHVEAACFPVRFLREAMAEGVRGERGFSAIATAVGQSKPGR